LPEAFEPHCIDIPMFYKASGNFYGKMTVAWFGVTGDFEPVS
jgi:hypothetical protein